MNLNLDWRKMGWFLKAKAKLWRAKFHFCPWVGPKEQLTVTSVNRYLHIKAESVDERQDLGIRSILLSVCSPRNIDQSHLIGLWLHAGRNAISETIDYGLFNCLTITGNTEEKVLAQILVFFYGHCPKKLNRHQVTADWFRGWCDSGGSRHITSHTTSKILQNFQHLRAMMILLFDLNNVIYLL